MVTSVAGSISSENGGICPNWEYIFTGKSENRKTEKKVLNFFIFLASLTKDKNLMTTEEIADALKLTAQLMELHGENSFKAKALANAAFRLDKTGIELRGKSLEELERVEGIGKSIA